MNIYAIKSFIKYGIDDTISREKLFSGCIGISFLTFVFGIVGLVSDYRTTESIICTYVLYLLTILFIILQWKLTKSLTFKKRILCYAANSIDVVICCSAAAWMFFRFGNIAFSFFWTLIPLFLGIISFLICYIRCLNDWYLNKKNNPKYKNLTPYATLGVAISMFLRRRGVSLGSNIMQPEVYISMCLLLIAGIYSIMGAPTLLKLYYLRKLKAMGIDVEN